MKKLLKRNKNIFIGMAAFMVLAAAGAAIFFWPIPCETVVWTEDEPSAVCDDIVWNDAEPMLFEQDGTLYMANGAESIALDGAKLIRRKDNIYIHGMLSADARWLFYIADYDEQTGGGTLMRAAADCQSQPVRVAADVCDAQLSDDGMVVVMRKGLADNTGDLYYCEMDAAGVAAEPELIAQDAHSMGLSDNGARVLYAATDSDGEESLFSWMHSGGAQLVAQSETFSEYGFSPDAQNIYFAAKTQDGGALYVQLGDAPIAEVTAYKGAVLPFFAGSEPLNGSWLTDGGQLVYYGEETLPGKPLYIYADGKTQKIAGPATPMPMFEDGSFVCLSQSGLYYIAPNQRKTLLTKQLASIPWFAKFGYADIEMKEQKRFLLTERHGGWDEPFALFEQEIGGSKVALCEADYLSYNINKDFTRLAYTADGKLYLTHKTRGGWSTPIVLCDGTQTVDISLGEQIFDVQGRYFYYKLIYEGQEGEYPKRGGIYRYTFDTGECELLMEDARQFYLIEDVPYVISADGALYRLDGGAQKLADGVRHVERTNGGVHAFTEADGRLFIGGGGETRALCSDAQKVMPNDAIAYLPSSSDEAKETLKMFYDAAQQCLSEIEKSEGIDMDVHGYLEMARNLLEFGSFSEEEFNIISRFEEGFGHAVWLQFNEDLDFIDTSEEVIEDISNTAKADFTDAIDAYNAYLDKNP